MALLLPPPEISSLTGRATPARAIPSIRSRSYDRIIVCSTEDLEMVVLRARNDSFDGVRWLYGQVKQSETAPCKRKEEVEKKKQQHDYFVNTGYAIRTLREEFPELFYRELSFDIYRDDIVFRDPINTFAGIDNYKAIFWGLRFHGRIFFRALWVDVVRVSQPVDNTITVRWTVHGIPRLSSERRAKFDGTSEYKLDKDGKIYEHRVHNIAINGPDKLQLLAVNQSIQSIACFEFSSRLNI